MNLYEELLNGSLITHEDLIDFDTTYAEPIRRTKTRINLKREASLSIDDKHSKIRPTTGKARSIKSAPTMCRSKSQSIPITKRKEKNINSSRRLPSAIPVYFYVLVVFFMFVSYLLSFYVVLSMFIQIEMIIRII